MSSSDESSDSENSVMFHLKQATKSYESIADSISRGNAYLAENARKHASTTNNNMKFRDNFSQLLILEVTKNEYAAAITMMSDHEVNRDLISLNYHAKTWNYFIGKPFGTTSYYPDDFDTTSIAWTVLPVRAPVVRSVIDEILNFNSNDGLVTTYFDNSRPRVDPVVCVNVLNLCYHHGFEDLPRLQATQAYVISVLENRSYLDGTRYYNSAEPFLYFLSRLVASPQAKALRESILPLLQDRIRERAGVSGDALELGMRLLASINADVGWSNLRPDNIWSKDILQLRGLQNKDGGWKTGWLCRYGKTGVLIGNRGLTTAMAVKALDEISSM